MCCDKCHILDSIVEEVFCLGGVLWVWHLYMILCLDFSSEKPASSIFQEHIGDGDERIRFQLTLS